MRDGRWVGECAAFGDAGRRATYRRRLGGRLRRKRHIRRRKTAGAGDRPRGARFGAKAGWLRQPPFGAHPW